MRLEGQAKIHYRERLCALRRGLQSLIDNTIKYVNGSHLRIEDADGELRLAVKDDGAGCSAVKWRSTQGIALEASVYARLRA